jgi:hypothetical protein
MLMARATQMNVSFGIAAAPFNVDFNEKVLAGRFYETGALTVGNADPCATASAIEKAITLALNLPTLVWSESAPGWIGPGSEAQSRVSAFCLKLYPFPPDGNGGSVSSSLR